MFGIYGMAEAVNILQSLTASGEVKPAKHAMNMAMKRMQISWAIVFLLRSMP